MCLILWLLDRDRRGKEAQAKAQADIEKYERELDQEFELFKSQVCAFSFISFILVMYLIFSQSGGSSEEVFRKLRMETDAQIHELQSNAKRNKEAIIAKLIGYVSEVNTDVHPNVVVAQKLGYAK